MGFSTFGSSVGLSCCPVAPVVWGGGKSIGWAGWAGAQSFLDDSPSSYALFLAVMKRLDKYKKVSESDLRSVASSGRTAIEKYCFLVKINEIHAFLYSLQSVHTTFSREACILANSLGKPIFHLRGASRGGNRSKIALANFFLSI